MAENTTTSDDIEWDAYADLVAATPPDVLWRALFGFPPDDPLFRGADDDGNSVREVVLLLTKGGAEGLPIPSGQDGRCWTLPARLGGRSGTKASEVLLRARDLVSSDEIATLAFEDDGRNAFDVAGQSPPISVEQETLSHFVRLLLGRDDNLLPAWWESPKAIVVIANRPDDAYWRVAISGIDFDLLTWRGGKAAEESFGMRNGDHRRLLDGPAGLPFRAVLGPSPADYSDRIAMAAKDPFFLRSAGSWLGVAAAEAFASLPGLMEGGRWRWSGLRRDALAAVCSRISGNYLGALAERVAITGPFEPDGVATTMEFVRAKHGGVVDPMAEFMRATMAGGDS